MPWQCILYTKYRVIEGCGIILVTIHPSSLFLLWLTVPQPTMDLVSSSTNPVVSGSLITLTCTVEFHEPVDAPVTINTVWTGPVGSAITGATYPAVMKSLTLYQSSVSTEVKDSGDYTCSVNLGGGTGVSATTSIETGKYI